MCTMLKVPDHQVAGHQAINGQLGPLIDESGRFYKPLDAEDKFFPKFYGTRLIEASDGSGQQPHLVLEDLTSTYVKPSIMDIKIGSRTWYPQASEDYIKKCFKKDKETSSLYLGFRISGLQIYVGPESGYWKSDKKQIRKLTADEVKLVLRKFVSSNKASESNGELDCAFASTVYGGSTGILAQLLELKSWFEDQTFYHFYSCSVLMFYDKGLVIKGEDPRAAVKLVDFPHVVEGNGIIDHNFLGGLCCFIKFISEILTGPNECITKAPLTN
ncbi:inositol polyphosphate multikinase [Ancistrocladus abbreviatus]